MKKIGNMTFFSLLVMYAMPGSASSDDPCGNKLQLTQRINRGESRLSQAVETLSASNVISREAQAEYQAGHSVTLLPGFSAEQGATFVAQVKTCDCEKNVYAGVNLEANRLTLTAYPNPFTEKTVIRYRLTKASPVNLSLLNEQGQTVDVLLNGEVQEAGLHEYTYRNASLHTMVYLYSLRTNQGTVSKRLVKQQ